MCSMPAKVIKLTVRSRTMANSNPHTHTHIKCPMKAINTWAQSTFVPTSALRLWGWASSVSAWKWLFVVVDVVQYEGHQTPLRQTNICTWLSPSLRYCQTLCTLPHTQKPNNVHTKSTYRSALPLGALWAVKAGARCYVERPSIIICRRRGQNYGDKQ